MQIRGGTSDKKWRIKEKGPRFTTLENLSPTNDADTIKIVEPHQIYHATIIPPSLQMPTEYDMYNANSAIPMNNMPSMTMNPYSMGPGIQINPTFVVGDNNVTAGKPTEETQTGGDNYVREPEKIIGTSSGKKIQFKENLETGGSGSQIEEKKEEKKEEVSSNSFFDFLKIRKLE